MIRNKSGLTLPSLIKRGSWDCLSQWETGAASLPAHSPTPVMEWGEEQEKQAPGTTCTCPIWLLAAAPIHLTSSEGHSLFGHGGSDSGVLFLDFCFPAAELLRLPLQALQKENHKLLLNGAVCFIQLLSLRFFLKIWSPGGPISLFLTEMFNVSFIPSQCCFSSHIFPPKEETSTRRPSSLQEATFH